MNSQSSQSTLKKLGKILVFSAAILGATKLTLEFGHLDNVSTAAFSFLIIVVLAAYFGDFLVAAITSIVATLCFDYFYLPPVGTFNITAFSDWISLAAFLFASVIISRLTASAAENTAKATLLDNTVLQLREFGRWLASTPNDQMTLTGIANEAVRIFSLDYCSIHVSGQGKWQHSTGASMLGITAEVENRLRLSQDHPTDLLDIATDNDLGVLYVQINKGTTSPALLVVKSRNLPITAIETMASMIGIRLVVSNTPSAIK